MSKSTPFCNSAFCCRWFAASNLDMLGDDEVMKDLLKFLSRLEERGIHYHLEHNRDDFIMVCIAIPGERWEVEFSSDGEVEIEIFKNSEGVFTDKRLLQDIFTINDGMEFEVKISLRDSADSNDFIERFLSEAIEPNGLAVGGNPLADGCYVSMYHRGSVSEKIRMTVENWIAQQPDVESYWVGELTENNPNNRDLSKD